MAYLATVAAGLCRPGDHPPVDERALPGGLTVAVTGEQVGEHFAVQVAHGDAMADAAQPVDRGAVPAQAAERGGQVHGHRERPAPAVGDGDPGQMRPQPGDVLLEVAPGLLVAVVVVQFQSVGRCALRTWASAEGVLIRGNLGGGPLARLCRLAGG